MSNYEFWDELGKIFEAVVAYQEKSVEFNKRFIHPWIRLGNVFDKQDRNTEAIRVYEKAIELEPDNAQNWYELGNIHFQMQNLGEAAAAYSKTIELEPDFGWSYSNLALTLATQGNFIEAVPLYQKGIDLLQASKDKAVVWNRLGNAYRKLDQYELALQAFQSADDLDEENAGFRDDLDEVPDGPSLVEGVGSENSGSETEMIVEPVLLSLAESPVMEPAQLEPVAETESPIEESQDGIVEAMADVLETVLETESQDTLTLEIQSQHRSTDSPSEEIAEQSVEAAPAVDEETPLNADPEPGPVTEEILEPSAGVVSAAKTAETVPAWVTQPPPVEVVETKGQAAFLEAEAAALAKAATNSAEAVEETVTTEDPEPVAAVVQEVAIVDADQSFDEIVVTEEIGPETQAETVAKVAVSEETAGSTEPDSEVQPEAVPVLEEVLALAIADEAAQPVLSPETAHAAYDVFLKDNEEPNQLQTSEADEVPAPEEAPASSEPVAEVGPSGEVRIEMDAKNAHVWNELGNVYFGTGSYDDAIVAYTKAIELDRWFAWPYSNLALSYMQKGRFAEATLLYQRSIELFSSEKDKAISWNRLGNVYRRLNDYDNAIAAYQRADEMDPDNSTLSLQSRFSLLGSFSSEQKPSYAL